jgi:hypothetical protein
MAISVPLEELETGTVLAEPVFNRFGQLLMDKGARISDRHLNVFKTWGITRVLIEGERDQEAVPVISQEIRNRAEARINKRLFWRPNNPMEEEIIHLAVEQAVQRSMQMGPKGSSGLDVFSYTLPPPWLKKDGGRNSSQ